MKLQLHEKILRTLFKSDEPLMLFDVGGCEGLSSVRYLNLFQQSTSFIFEPVPRNIEKIKKNKADHQLEQLTIIEQALSSKEGKATFYVSSGSPKKNKVLKDASVNFGNKSSSLLAPHLTKEVHPWLKFKEKITVPTTTLEKFCKTLKIDGIDFMHMDVQGAELEVLKGSNGLLKKINSIWLEVERIPLYKNQALKDEIESFLKANNFICVLSKIGYISGDQFWVHKSYFKSLPLSKRFKLIFVKFLFTIKSNLSIFVGCIKFQLKKSHKKS